MQAVAACPYDCPSYRRPSNAGSVASEGMWVLLLEVRFYPQLTLAVVRYVIDLDPGNKMYATFKAVGQYVETEGSRDVFFALDGVFRHCRLYS